MPIVFIHGVSTRSGPDNDRAIASRDAFFRSALGSQVLKNKNPKIFNPMWGDLVPVLPYPNPIVPLPEEARLFQALGASAAPLPAGMLPPKVFVQNATQNPKGRLATLAKQAFPEAVDAVFGAAMDAAIGPAQKQAAAQSALVGANYAEENPNPDWVGTLSDDDEFIKKLIEKLKGWSRGGTSGSTIAPPPGPGAGQQAFEGLGVDDLINSVLAGAQNLKDRLTDLPTDALLNQIKPALTEQLTLFLGDVFSYLADRGDKNAPGSIPKLLVPVLQNAALISQQTKERLVIVGHSMGGVILYDLLTYFCPDISVDALVTVGSQTSFFRQLGLFEAIKAGPQKAPLPSGVKNWLNVFDVQDILSFRYEPEFDGVRDFDFATHAGLFGAHLGYFIRPMFYQRLATRLAALLP